MSVLEELLKKHCPDGVEYVPLWSVTIWDKKFNSVDKDKQKTTIKYKYYLADELKELVVENGDVKILTTNISNLFTLEKLVSNSLSYGEIVSIPWGGNPIVQYYKGKFITSDNRIATSIDVNKLDNKFLYYVLINKLDLISSFYRGAGIKHPDMSKVLDIIIPLPPIEVQKEIVGILDTFTKYQDLLNRELELRKKQYEYYRDKLLTFNDEVEYKFLGEVCNVQSGGTPLKTKVEYWENGNIKWLGSGVCKNKKTVDEITDYISELGLTKSSAKLMKKNTTLIALVGATIGKVAFLPFEAAINQNIAGVYPIDTKKLNPSFVYYICTTYYKDFINLGNGKLTMANLSFVRNLKIPIPPLEEQERIVKILDQFDTLCNDITRGLPAEIELRKKQYEYYRDKLLTFKEKKV
ncbi:restriction endonuclease subunit S [Brachyspira pilosicoli]|uniref:restriction endonuclease subunit S n=1 Tax=Brachyspira pilosicoli TaxID=52584 RepID=UPI0030056921